MLAVSSWLTPENGPSLIIHLFATLGDVFSIRLHISLLEVGWETMHVLIIRQDGESLGLVKVVVPKSNQCQLHQYNVNEGMRA